MKLTKFRLERGPQGANESIPKKKREEHIKISVSNCVKINIETRFLVLEYKFETVDRELWGIGSSTENKMYKLAVDVSHRDENGCRVRRI
jgi:hypothetical protein